jgi:hypothetical protein
MSLSPVAFIAPSYTDFKGRWIKFYEPGTTTAKIIYLDAESVATAAKVQINSDGFIVSAASAIVVPYIAGSYDAYIFVTEADADANDTSGAERIADNISSNPSDSVNVFDNVDAMKAASLNTGNTALCKRYYASGALVDGLQYEIQASSTVDGFIDHTLANSNAARLIIGPFLTAEQAGVKKDGTDDSLALNAALATQLNVVVGAGKVSLANPVQIKFDGQSLSGFGTYNTELEWIGTDNTKNMIELWTGRRDIGGAGLATTNQRFSNFKISTKTGSAINCLIWVEAGCFHGWIEKIRGFDIRGSVPQSAVIKYDTNGGQSYPLGMNMRDVVITGGLNDDLVPFPVGIWLEGGIELFFESVKSYSMQVGWRFGASNVADIRNLVNCTFVHCQSEIGDRGFADGNGIAFEFFQGRDLTFQSCKLMAGVDFADPTTQLPIKFSGADNFQNKAITFDNCTIWGQNTCANAMSFDSNVNYQGVKFLSTEFYQYTGSLITTTGNDIPTVYMDENCTFVGCEATLANFDLESISTEGFSINNASGLTQTLQIGNNTTQIKKGEAILLAYSQNTVGALFSAYKFSSDSVRVRSYNRAGATVTLTAGYYYTRGVGKHNSESSSYKTYDPASIASLATETTTVTLKGANLGDIVTASFDQDMQDVNLFAYVSAVDTVTVCFVNRAGASRNLVSGVLRVFKIESVLEIFTSSVVDLPSLIANAGTTITQAVPDAEVGDIVTYSLSVDLQQIVGYAWVSVDGTVSIRFQNESGVTVDLASCTLITGIIKTPRSL